MFGNKFPPLKTLRAFAAAGTRESFQEAAADLGVTPSAISHQVRALEEWVGAPLFERSVRKVTLTPLGSILAGQVNSGFNEISTALIEARAGAVETKLRVSSLPLLTNTWLIPRLAGFEEKFPGLSIEIETTNKVVPLDRDSVDVAIRNTSSPTPGLVAHKLLDLQAIPVCMPSLARELNKPSDLENTTLIHISSRPEGWSNWLRDAGVSGLTAKSNLSFDTVTSALEAAVMGRGVLLGLMPIIWGAPTASDLVVPFQAPLRSAGTFFVVYRKEDRSRLVVRAFVDWLVGEMRADFRRLSRQTKSKMSAR